MRRVLIVTGSDADWAWLSSVAKDLRAKGVDVRIAKVNSHDVTGDYVFDFTGVARTQNMLDLFAEVAKEFGAFLESVVEGTYDAAIVLGDRVEIVAAVCTLFTKKVPVYHIAAGDVSGCLDDAYRDAISILSTRLYVSNLHSFDRAVHIKNLREGRNIESVELVKFPVQVDKFCAMEVAEEEFAIARFHPETSVDEPVEDWIYQTVMRAFRDNLTLLIFPSNKDDGWERIEAAWKDQIVKTPGLNYVYAFHLKREKYLALLQNAKWVAGNSSSFVVEAPVVGQHNVFLYGHRQHNRVKMENSGIDLADAIYKDLRTS